MATEVETKTTPEAQKDAKTKPEDTLPITVEFSGGLEMLFSNQRVHKISIPSKESTSSSPPTISWLIDHLCKTLLKDPRKELFVLDGNVRPGILVLINEADWSLEGEENYEIQAKDHIMFISTLHGG